MHPIGKENQSTMPGIAFIPVRVVRVVEGKEALKPEQIDESTIESLFMDPQADDSKESDFFFRRTRLKVTDPESGMTVYTRINCLIFLRDGRILPCVCRIEDIREAGWNQCLA